MPTPYSIMLCPFSLRPGSSSEAWLPQTPWCSQTSKMETSTWPRLGGTCWRITPPKLLSRSQRPGCSGRMWGCTSVWFTSLLTVLLSCIIGFRLAQCQGYRGPCQMVLLFTSGLGPRLPGRTTFRRQPRVLRNLLHLSLSHSVTLEKSQVFSTPQCLWL